MALVALESCSHYLGYMIAGLDEFALIFLAVPSLILMKGEGSICLPKIKYYYRAEESRMHSELPRIFLYFLCGKVLNSIVYRVKINVTDV